MDGQGSGAVTRAIRTGEGLGRGVRAREQRVLITLGDGVPVARVRVPDPGRASEAFERALLLPHAEPASAHAELLERMRRRLGVPQRDAERPTCSVVVCTHRRPSMLAGLLQACELLDPAPDQIVVVDNDPGEQDVRRLVEAAGAVYVRENRRGLDHARSAGLAGATGDLVAFIDDDCLPPARWLRNLAELFEDPCVGAVTGPAFAHDLDSPAKLAFEDSGGFLRGFQRRVHEWTTLSPPAATRAGAGANMILRRSLALELGELFPPELDAGTLTQSGGDLYALYRVLAAGRRIVYDPGTFVYHRHRPGLEDMRKAIHGYGVGLSAALTKLLLEERELAAPAAWWWLAAQYLEARVERLAGRASETQLEIASHYLRGGLRGTTAWLRTRPLRRPRASAPAVVEPPAAAPRATGEPELSVIVTTHNRPAALRRAISALAAQDDGTPPFELIVVNDGRPLATPDWVRLIDTGGVGTAAARNAGAAAARGPLLLFLDDDVVAGPDLVLRHAEAHRGGERAVIGHCTPRPRTSNLTSLGAVNWWEDHFRAKRDAVAMTFVDVLSGNMSVSRETFEQLGGFDPALGRREDWDWGIRLLEAGVEAVYEPWARADHEFSLTAGRAIEAARRHGRSDARLIARYPAAAVSLPRRWAYRSMLRRPLKASLFLALRHRPARRLGLLALALLEAARARVYWARLFGLMLGAAYESGRQQGGDPRRARLEPPAIDVELHSDAPIPAPTVASPRIRLLEHGEPVGEVWPLAGHWEGALAEQIASAACGRIRAERPEPPSSEGVAVLRGDDWAELDRAIRLSSAQVVAIPLSGESDPGWLAEALVALDAERVALACGAAVPADEPERAIVLHDRTGAPEPFPALGRPPAYLLVRRAAYVRLGGFDLSCAALGAQALVLDLGEQALNAGLLVAVRDVRGLDQARERSESLRRTRARAALLSRAAGGRPPLRPALARLAAGILPGGPTLLGGVAHGAAWLAGAIYGSAAPPAAAALPSGSASQRCEGRSRPSPAERPVTRSG